MEDFIFFSFYAHNLKKIKGNQKLSPPPPLQNNNEATAKKFHNFFQILKKVGKIEEKKIEAKYSKTVV